MKKIIKNILIGLLIFILFLCLIFGLGYYSKIKRDLVDYNISEKIVVKFKNDDNKYLVNLNDGNYIKYEGEYKEYFPITYEDEKLFINKKIYNKNEEFHFYYISDKYFDMKKIYNKNEEVIYDYLYPRFNQGYWSQDGNYLITREGYIARMFGLFISKRTGFEVLSIMNPELGKTKQLDIIDENGRYLEIESILGYLE